ncbi:hypothetical protein WDU94_009960 [Cyamophila willieti]
MGMTEKFIIESGFRQGGVLSPLLFITVMNEIQERVEHQLGKDKMKLMLFADDLCLWGDKRNEIQEQIDEWTEIARDSLIETVRRSQLRFVHCLLPHHTAGLIPMDSRQGGHGFNSLVNIPLLRSQLRGAQLLAAARLHKQGYPRCMPLTEFRRRFQLLSVSGDSSTQPTSNSGTGEHDKAAVEEILLSLDLDHSAYRVGLSQVR